MTHMISKAFVQSMTKPIIMELKKCFNTQGEVEISLVGFGVWMTTQLKD
jgi:hypothetical protein